MTDWPKLLLEHGPMVWKTVYRLVNQDSDADDCFQNTFVAAWRQAQREPVKSWTALLLHLATMQALACLRTRVKARTQEQPIHSADFVDKKSARPDDVLIHQEMAQRFREALSTIDSRQAVIFCMAYFEELSYEEIAEACGISISHVGVLFHRAKSALKAQLQSHYEPMTELMVPTVLKEKLA